MKMFRKHRWLVLATLLMSFVSWLGYRNWTAYERQMEDKRRRSMLIGTWVVQKADEKKSGSSVRSYWIFSQDGTGESIFEEKGKRAHLPFSYTVADTVADMGVGFSQLKITCEWAYCKGIVVTLDDSCIPKNARQEKVVSLPIYIGLDRNHISINPYGSFVGTEPLDWSRIELKPLSGEIDLQQVKVEDRKLRLIGTWDVLQEEESDKQSGFKAYYKFNRDGTGDEIFEERGQRQNAPFTYTFTGSRIDSRLEITSDFTYYGGKVLFLNDPSIPTNDSRIPTDVLQARVISFPVYFGTNRNRIYLRPDLSDAAKGTTYWQGVVLKPLPGEEEECNDLPLTTRDFPPRQPMS